ncbi:flavin reductase family protein [Saccharothrix longispora]|uniref:Flavin reductase (DIM6/NTAB) family NADH-FMN oxidoreductase RutF n=1 Tax=Saccharothrix longispora TaxID=33920 RepID=A0ABU1PVJ3_9PSEU|nr:flavin reductase family protein [Saccharothrix longispora]MDR6594670.1 flavin reductase (DIM6/NTAB) family NADH-FMN oxidoreductase RutF [Saccharothrix longispora]
MNARRGDLTARVGPDDHRALMGSFPTGVAVVTAVGADGAPRGMTCTSLASVTLDPPTLLVCLDTARRTTAAVRRGRFGVNLLHAPGRRAAEVFSSPVPDRFGAVAWRSAAVTGMPWLFEDSLAFAGCVVRESTVVGDHVVVLGEVSEINWSGGTPLMYGRREFSTWAP